MDVTKKIVDDVALVFEGGGMRASYTSAVVNTLLDAGIAFQNVYGVSAGSSNAVNYLAQDTWRTRASFTDLAQDPQFGGISTFLMHKGIFNAHYIYQESCLPQGALPFTFETFSANPAQVTIEGFDRETGDTLYWTRDDLGTLSDLMVRVQASSSLPLAMPATFVGGRACYDGGLGEGAGIMVPRAVADGFEKLFVVCTRPKGYRKTEKHSAFVDALFWRRPHVRKALATRSARYNTELDNLEKLEVEGRALVFYAEEQGVENGERDVVKLRANYERGKRQATRDFDSWLTFLGV